VLFFLLTSTILNPPKFDNLKEQMGAYTFAFSIRSHIHDTFQASWINSKGAIDFTTEVLGMSKADIAQKFELWAIARENGTFTNLLLSSPFFHSLTSISP
jgi:hypothetical protein